VTETIQPTTTRTTKIQDFIKSPSDPAITKIRLIKCPQRPMPSRTSPSTSEAEEEDTKNKVPDPFI
jgi:hypothetical protein